MISQSEVKVRHTPGPWVVNGDFIEDTKNYPATICNIYGEYDNWGVDNEGDANAHLIASAPDLLEACKIVLEYFDCQNHPKDIKEQIAFKAHQKEVLESAIRKAEGGKNHG